MSLVDNEQQGYHTVPTLYEIEIHIPLFSALPQISSATLLVLKALHHRVHEH